MSPKAAALALLLAAAPALADEYRLQRGDLLELVVVAPPLREEMRIDIDGNVTLPIVGALPAEGRSLAEVAAEARERLAAASLPPIAPGETLPARIWPATITLSLRDYRPIYVGGEVRAGGAFPFFPGLTARRAVILAGGYGRAGDSALQRLELEGALAQLRAKRAATGARLDRLRLDFGERGRPAPRARAQHPRAPAQPGRHGGRLLRRGDPPHRGADRGPDGTARQRDRGHVRRPRRLRADRGHARSRHRHRAPPQRRPPRAPLLHHPPAPDRHRARPHHPRARRRQLREAAADHGPAPAGDERSERRGPSSSPSSTRRSPPPNASSPGSAPARPRRSCRSPAATGRRSASPPTRTGRSRPATS